MATKPSIADEADDYLRTVAAEPEDPRRGECLRCYVRRMVSRRGCDGRHRWVGRWQREKPEPTPGLRSRLERRGGYCDCEVVLNVFQDYIPRPTDPIPPCQDGQN